MIGIRRPKTRTEAKTFEKASTYTPYNFKATD